MVFQYGFRALLRPSVSGRKDGSIRSCRVGSNIAGPGRTMSPLTRMRTQRTSEGMLTSGLSADGFVNPYLPMSAGAEYSRIKRHFNKALDTWNHLFQTSNNPPRSCNTRTIIPLIHFCHMVLEAGDAIWLLPALAGYVPVPDTSPDSHAYVAPVTISKDAIPSFGNAAVAAAWQILESIDSADSYPATENSESTITPVWYPLILFYAALVVWSRYIHDSYTNNTWSTKPARKWLLGAFQLELEHVQPQWESTRRMIQTIKGLILAD
ncbi:hypothetical protein H2204_009962 [Knufia peltigerae]|uniref:Uncharacterized protein n=1 Tax=Knufia peltigerae TaxID=1002370 RepID=A0AA38XXX3_9EURO|nr:hypothetical protein H2204_009962 [Knufia peltigerae]